MDNEVNNCPGRSCYLISFMLDGFHYIWNTDKRGYYSITTGVVLDSMPVGAYDLEWSNTDPDEEDNYRAKWGILS